MGKIPKLPNYTRFIQSLIFLYENIKISLFQENTQISEHFLGTKIHQKHLNKIYKLQFNALAIIQAFAAL